LNMGSLTSGESIIISTPESLTSPPYSQEHFANAKVFNPISRQTGGAEGILCSNDRRLKKNQDTNPYYFIGQLIATMSNGKNFVGTATYIGQCQDSGKHFIITCAHLVKFQCDNGEGTVVEVKSGSVFFFFNGREFECKVTEWIIHPDYLKEMKTYSGADIALAVITPPPFNGYPGIIRSEKWSCKQENNVPICIYGYPAEKNKDKKGELYGMKGSSNSLRMVNGTNRKDLIQYSDIDTSGGQSGSSIILRLETDIGTVFCIGGIHVAEDQGNNVNYGTLITQEKLKWICKHKKPELTFKTTKNIKEFDD